MKPEDAFTKKSLKRYNALKKIVKGIKLPAWRTAIVGRERLIEGKSDIVYLEMRHEHAFSEGRSCRRFYFNSTPTKYEVEQIIWLLSDAMIRSDEQ